jgi:hypothetical protein
VLGWQDPPHESYAGAMARLQAAARARGWRWSKDGVDVVDAVHCRQGLEDKGGSNGEGARRS